MTFSYEQKPQAIEDTSFAMIRTVLASYAVPKALLPVVIRVVHAGADFSLASLVTVGGTTVPDLAARLRRGGRLFCDVSMLAAGISRKIAAACGLDPFASVHDESVAEKAAAKGITRAMAAVDMAVAQGVRLFAFGNAPTALFRLLEHAREGAPVDAVIGMPVGFVGAADSKEALLASGLPCLTLRGPRGGSNLCAAALNALLRMDDAPAS
jgi:precorrin-8X/cobalt-precorrin-8 methylmutase